VVGGDGESRSPSVGPAPRGTLGFCSVGSAEPTIFSTMLLLSGVRRLGLVHADTQSTTGTRRVILTGGTYRRSVSTLNDGVPEQSLRVLRSRRVWWRMDAVNELYLLRRLTSSQAA